MTYCGLCDSDQHVARDCPSATRLFEAEAEPFYEDEGFFHE